jgi:hypothetical protein
MRNIKNKNCSLTARGKSGPEQDEAKPRICGARAAIQPGSQT